MAGRSSVVSDRLQTPSEKSRHSSPNPLVTVVMEMFISVENMNKMENFLDTWSENPKTNVLMELRKWKLAFMEQHKLEVRKEREKHAACIAGLTAKMDNLKELLHTYETSNQRKDEVIVNLSQTVDRQRERLELMRTFTHWRLQHSEARKEVREGERGHPHRGIGLGWMRWGALPSAAEEEGVGRLARPGPGEEKVEKACRTQAEEVYVHLSADYEDKMAELRREELHTLHTHTDAPPPRHDPGSGSLGYLQPRTAASVRFSPLHFDPPVPPPQSDAEETVGSSAPASRAEVFPSTTVVHSSLQPGGTASSHRQKASKTMAARVTTRSDLCIPSFVHTPGNLQVMGVAPPMSCHRGAQSPRHTAHGGSGHSS
ncbi:unnamed protein product [Coregonus sp. 'balchen']|nr:unnamed protein product [Coregonus sp. 'balchen']